MFIGLACDDTFRMYSKIVGLFIDVQCTISYVYIMFVECYRCEYFIA